jgi:hypothetical protein
MRYLVFKPANIVSAVPVQNQPLVAQVVQTNKPTPPQTVQTASTSVQSTSTPAPKSTGQPVSTSVKTMPQQTLATASKPTVQSTTSSAQPQGLSAGGYTRANTGLSSPGNISSVKPPHVTTQPANKGQGKSDSEAGAVEDRGQTLRSVGWGNNRECRRCPATQTASCKRYQGGTTDKKPTGEE